MEEKNRVDKPSSFTAELFGPKDMSAAGIFGSIFAPNSKVLERESVPSEVAGGKPDHPQNESCNPNPGGSVKSREGASNSMLSRDSGTNYHEQRVQQPCSLSSSIYYGGQDIYNHPQASQDSNTNSIEEGVEDESGSASRGNWWQGSLYY